LLSRILSFSFALASFNFRFSPICSCFLMLDWRFFSSFARFFDNFGLEAVSPPTTDGESGEVPDTTESGEGDG
jgi:hypothetical protein